MFIIIIFCMNSIPHSSPAPRGPIRAAHQAEKLLNAGLRGRHAADDVVLEGRAHEATADVDMHVRGHLSRPALTYLECSWLASICIILMST